MVSRLTVSFHAAGDGRPALGCTRLGRDSAQPHQRETTRRAAQNVPPYAASVKHSDCLYLDQYPIQRHTHGCSGWLIGWEEFSIHLVVGLEVTELVLEVRRYVADVG